MSPGKAGARREAGPVLAMLAVCAAVWMWLFAGNPRLLASWHGFLHSGIATSFARSLPPENPFFAGEPLPYYWAYHLTGYWLSRLMHVNLLLTFQIISWASLAALVIIAGRIGRRYFASGAAGVAVAYLALCGVNPLGPAIALAKNVSRGEPLVERWQGPVETTFVSNAQADRMMAQPWLGAMYLGSDWRQGPNVVWFFDIGSRAPALAGLLALVYLVLRPELEAWRIAAIVAVSAAVTALNPLVGLAVTGVLGLACAVAGARERTWTPLILSAGCGVGALLALPAYYQMFFRVSGGSGFALRDGLGLPVTAVNFSALALLAVLGAKQAGRTMLTAIVIAGCLLLLLLAFVHLPEGNEHNLGNAAQCLLAVAAGAWVARAPRIRAAAAAGMFLPVAVATLGAFAWRPPMPVAAGGAELRRLPAGSDLDRFYQWAGRETAPESIFIVDPEAPVKVSGNASEFPAFTGRALFTDQANYLTSPNRDAAFRAQLASDVTHGRQLDSRQRDYLRRFARPVYTVAYGSGESDRMAGFYGPPVFHEGIVTAYRIAETQARR